VAAGRIRRRAAVGGDPSDAIPEIAAKLAVDANPWAAAMVDTSSGPAEVLVKTLALVGRSSG